MTAALEQLLKQGRNKLPDISEFHYTQTTQEDAFNQNANSQASNYDAYQQAVIQQIALKKSQGILGDVQKLVNAFNELGNVRERNFDRQVKRNFRKNYTQGSDQVEKAIATEADTVAKAASGSTDVDLDQDLSAAFKPDTKALNVAIIDRNELEREKNTFISTSPTYDFDAIELKKPNPLIKLNRNQADIASRGFQLSLTTFAKMQNLKQYKVESKDFTGITSFTEALREGWKMDDGSSMAEHIRREIFADIFLETGLNNVSNLHLKKYYFEPLSEWLKETQIKEAIKYIEQVDENYKAEERANFLTGLDGNVAEFLTGSEADKGTSGFFYKYDQGQGLAKSAEVIEAKFRDLEENNLLTSAIINKVLNAEYYVKGEKKPLTLDKWKAKDKRLTNLHNYLSEAEGRLAKDELTNRNASDLSISKNTVSNIVAALEKEFPDNLKGFTQEEKNKRIPIWFDEFKKNKSLSPYMKGVVTIDHPFFESIVNQIPTEEIVSDIKAMNNAQLALLDGNNRDVGFWMNQVDPANKDALANYRKASLNYQQNGTNITQAFQSTRKSGITELDTVIDRHLKETKQEHWTGTVSNRAKADYDTQLSKCMLGGNTGGFCHQQAINHVKTKIENDKYVELPPGFKPKEQQDNERVIKETFKLIDDEIGKENILTHSEFYPGELAVLNWYNNPVNEGLNHPLYTRLASHYFPGMTAEEVRLERLKVLNQRQFSDAEKYILKKYHRVDPKDLDKWLSNERIAELEQKILKSLKRQSESIEKVHPEVGDLAIVQKKDVSIKDAIKLANDEKLLNSLNDNSTAGEIHNYLVESGFAIEPIFEALYSKKALRGNGFNHILKNGVNWKFDKDVTSSTLSEVMTSVVDDPSTGAKWNIGIFGLTTDEINAYIKAEGITPEQASTIIFDEEFQGKVMYYKIKNTISKNNSLSSITANNFRRLSKLPRKKREAFMNNIKSGMILSQEWTTDMAIDDQSLSIVNSVWHDPSLLSSALVDYLSSKDYLNLDVEGQSGSTSSERAIEQILKQPPSKERDELIESIRNLESKRKK
tara:strand:+ start:455 stop:3604 length:3150 start_codon:yes stop_codon:yes gene_type:complete